MNGMLGFSYIGFIFLLMLVIPNLIWARHQPVGYSPAGEPKLLLFFERSGQVLSTTSLIIFHSLNLKPFDTKTIWLLIAVVLMVLYEICWIRYFTGGCTLRDFYGSFLAIPVPLALLPLSALICLGLYAQVIWLILSTVIFAIGHIGIHIQHLREL